MLLKDDTELPDEMHVGDPVTRTIRLQAQGLGFEQLPELTLTRARRRRDLSGQTRYAHARRRHLAVRRARAQVRVRAEPAGHVDDSRRSACAGGIPRTIARKPSELPARTIKVLPAVGASPRREAAFGRRRHRMRNRRSMRHAVAACDRYCDRLHRLHVAAHLAGARGARTRAVAGHARAVVAIAPHVLPTACRRPAPQAGASAHRAAFLRAASLGELAGAERALIAWARSERPDVRNLGELAGTPDKIPRSTMRSPRCSARVTRARRRRASARSSSARSRAASRGASAASRRKDKSPLPALYPE